MVTMVIIELFTKCCYQKNLFNFIQKLMYLKPCKTYQNNMNSFIGKGWAMEKLKECRETESFCIQLIYEFLICNNFNKTIEVFTNEVERSQLFHFHEKLPTKKDKIEENDVLQILSAMDNKDHLQFFEKWSAHIPSNIKSIEEYTNLTLSLYTYFATLPMRDVIPVINDEVTNTSIITIPEEIDKADDEPEKEEPLNKTYVIDTQIRISDLKKTNDFPDVHFAEQVEPDSLENESGNSKEPSAMAMFQEFLLEKKYSLSTEPQYLPLFALPFIENPKQHKAFADVFEEKWVCELKKSMSGFLIRYSCGDTVIPEIVKVCRENKRLFNLVKTYNNNIDEYSKQIKEVKRKFHKLKRDHKNLVGVANVLATALESSVKGETVDLNFTLSKCVQIFPDLFPRTQIAQTNIHRMSIEKTIEDQIKLNPAHLDGSKIKDQLTSGSIKAQLLLLQALRMYICEVDRDERECVVSWMWREDILGLAGGVCADWLETAGAHPLQQSVARILNAVSSLHVGRDYIASVGGPFLVHLIVGAVARQTSHSDSITQDMLVATLQKLSLRKDMCEKMIQEGLLDWCGDKLRQVEVGYGLEYSSSLFMNLSIHAPISYWDTRPHQVIPTLLTLLSSSSHQVMEFACGSLYCLLRSDKVNIFARSVGASATIGSMESPDLQRQKEALLSLHHRHANTPPTSINLHSRYTESQLDDPEEIEPEVNKDDLVKGILTWEHFLSQNYSLVFTAPSVVGRPSNVEFNLRPSTPTANLPTWAQ